MMKRILQITILFVLTPCLHAQNAGALTKDGFVRLENNLAILAPDENLRGSFQWQRSIDQETWSDIDTNMTGRAIALLPYQTAYYRMIVTEGNCIHIFSDTLKLFSRHTNFSEYLDEGLSIPDLLVAGFSVIELYEGGFLVGKLEQNGVDSIDLANAGLIGTVADFEGNQYKWVRIGDQIWIAENLRTRKYNDGTDIPLVTNDFEWEFNRSGAYCWYRNDSARFADTYGALYNWYAIDTVANGGKNVCPSGWHVPSDAEWTELTDYIGGENVAGGKLKENGTTHWSSPNTGANNETGFTALPAGLRWDFGYFDAINHLGRCWSATPYLVWGSWFRGFIFNQSSVQCDYYLKTSGFPIRCMRD